MRVQKNKNRENLKCPICHIYFQHDIDYIFKCNRCGLLHSFLLAGTGRGVSGLKVLREMNFYKILNKISPMLRKGARILEVGSGDGWFLDICKKHNISCIGIEPYATSGLIERHPNTLQMEFPCKLVDVGGKKFEAIIFNDVLEHLHDIEATLTCCKSLLASGGILIINIPTSGGIFYRLARLLASIRIQEPLDRLWQKGLASPHIWYFNHRNLPKLIGVKPILQMRLQTAVRAGLKARVTSTGSRKATSWIKYFSVLCLTILSPLLPGDIMLHCYRIK